MQISRIDSILQENDRRGEKAIALFQMLIAAIVLLLHVIAASKNGWTTLNATTILIVWGILGASFLRVYLASREKFRNWPLHLLSVLDGALIFAIIYSYGAAYGLPPESTFKAPTTVFLFLYTVIRALRFDPVPILVAGCTVVGGWMFLLSSVAMQGARITTSYVEYLTTNKLLIGAIFEVAIGYVGMVAVLVLAMIYARRFAKNTAHVEDLAHANLRAEDNLANYDELLNSSVDAIVIVDKEGNIERINSAFEKLFGYSENEIVRQSVARLMSEDHAMKLRAAIEMFLTTNQSELVGQSFESQGIAKDGSVLEIEIAISNFTASGMECFAGFIRDIGERKKAQASEKKALSQFERAVNAAMDAIIIIDESGEVVSFNPAAEEIFGYENSHAIGRKLSELIIPEKYREAHENGMKHYLATGEGPVIANRIEIEGMHASGTEMLLELAIQDMDSNNGKVFIGYARDITEQKKTEEELISAKIDAESASRAKASFLAMMSHEIRTPLNGVLGILSLIKETKLDRDQEKLLNTAKESGQSLLTIINDILDFSKLEAGKFEIQKGSFDATRLIRSVIRLIQPQVEEKGLEIEFHSDENVPQILHGDADRIRQVLLNLAWNAVKFTETGKVKITMEEKEGKLRFCVIDTGIGIPAENQDKLFAEFTTLDSEYVSRFGGTGLGLAICKALVNAMDGEIGVFSEHGKGSVFWFNLPLEIGEIEGVVKEDAEVLLPDDLLKGVKILVAEDNATNQLVVSRYLKQLQCEFDLASNGKEAVNALSSKLYDVILMDVSMPEMDGFEATRIIRESDDPEMSGIPIIALTAYASMEDRRKLLAAGMDEVLPKPVFKEDLKRAVSDLLNSKLQQSENAVSSEIELINQDILDSIVDGMDAEELERLFAEFRKDIQRYLKSAHEGLDQNDNPTLERASHGLKGAAGIMGASLLADLAGQVNERCLEEVEPVELVNLAAEMVKVASNVLQESDRLKSVYTDRLNEVGS